MISCDDFKETRVKLSNPINIEKSEIYDEISDGVTVRQSNIQLTCRDYRRNSVKTRLRCSLLNCTYTLQVLQQVATND